MTAPRPARTPHGTYTKPRRIWPTACALIMTATLSGSLVFAGLQLKATCDMLADVRDALGEPRASDMEDRIDKAISLPAQPQEQPSTPAQPRKTSLKSKNGR